MGTRPLLWSFKQRLLGIILQSLKKGTFYPNALVVTTFSFSIIGEGLGRGGEGEEEIEGREKERERLTFLLLFGTVNIIKILGNFRKTKGALEKAKLYVASGCYSLVERQPGGSECWH